MAKFLRPSKKRFKNAQHFAFIDAFLTIAEAAGFSAARIVTLLTALRTAFNDEDGWYKVSRASDTIKKREEADRLRDTYYGRLNMLSRLWAGSGETQKDPAGTAVQRILKVYHLNVKSQMDEETGVMDNVIQELRKPEMLAHIATLQGTYLLEQMETQNALVKSLRLEQGLETAEKVKGALEKARIACDKLYDELINLIEAFSLTAENTAPYENFIHQWNGTLKIYQDILDRKSGTSTSSGSDNAAGGSSSGGGSGAGGEDSGSGSDEGGGSGEGSGSGSGEGGGSGEGSGSGGDDSGGSGGGSGSGDDDSGGSGGGGGNVLG